MFFQVYILLNLDGTLPTSPGERDNNRLKGKNNPIRGNFALRWDRVCPPCPRANIIVLYSLLLSGRSPGSDLVGLHKEPDISDAEIFTYDVL